MITTTTTCTLCTIKEVQAIINVSAATASNKIRQLRDALNKPKPKIITMEEFRDYYGV